MLTCQKLMIQVQMMTHHKMTDTHYEPILRFTIYHLAIMLGGY